MGDLAVDVDLLVRDFPLGPMQKKWLAMEDSNSWEFISLACLLPQTLKSQDPSVQQGR